MVHSIQRKDVIIINIYTHNGRPSKYMKQDLTELKGEIDSSTVIPGGFNTSLTIIEQPDRSKENRI